MKRLLILIFFNVLLFANIKVNLPIDIHHNLHDTVEIPITISDVTDSNITSINFKISYDSTIINIIGYNNTNTMTDNMMITSNPSTGKIIIGGFSTTPLIGEGILIYLKVVCINNGKSPLIWDHFLYGVKSISDKNDGSILVGIVKVDDEEKKSLIDDFSLEQNYPNPFNLSTNIKYSVNKQNHVVLKVFNMLGVEISELVNSSQPKGIYEVFWNASEIPSGIYFYSIEMKSEYGEVYFRQVKKMILLK